MLRDVRGVGAAQESLTQRIGQRVIGSRFQELHRDSLACGRIPLGSHVQLDDRTGTLGPVRFSQDQLRHGPNEPSSGDATEARGPGSADAAQRGSSAAEYARDPSSAGERLPRGSGR